MYEKKANNKNKMILNTSKNNIINNSQLVPKILYDPDMGNFNAPLHCISKDKKDITCISDFTGAYHRDEHIVRKITYKDTFIKVNFMD